MQRLPEGTVTFLFTDIEGSTRLLQRLGDRYAELLQVHHRLLREAFTERGGHEVDTQGDAFFVVFPRARDAVMATVDAQRALAAHPWPDNQRVRVRMGLHTGTPILAGDCYVGLDIHRAARIASSAHGGQVVLSSTTRGLLDDELPDAVTFKDLGPHRLKDLHQPERIFQVLHPELDEDFLPLKTLDLHHHNLPAQATPFIGREREVEEIRRRLLSPDVRLLTLVGTGGTGKTRLAFRLAEDLIDQFEHGAYFVSLAAVNDEELAVSAIAQALGVRELPGHPLARSLEEYLSTKLLLLVLDNLEQVLDAASTIARLLEASPGLTVLATSREALRVYGEHIAMISPLALPVPGGAALQVQDLVRCDAVRLFIERAQAVKPDFAVTDETARTIAEICGRLDGLPLAIELAAARARVLPLRLILERLERRLEILTGGARDRPARQQTLRATIAWSYDLLTDPEQQLLRRLGIFAGSCTLDAVEAVCFPPDRSEPDVLERLVALADKSLIRLEDQGDRPRVLMLETLREYALEQLAAADELSEAQARHARFYTNLAATTEPHLVGPDQAAWLERLDAEHDNFRTALRWSLGAEDRSPGLVLAGALARFWEIRGHLTEGRERLRALLTDGAEASPQSTAYAKALNGLGNLAYRQADYEAARAAYHQSLALWRQLEVTRGVAASLNNLALIACDQGDYGTARALFEEALQVKRDAGEEREVADMLGNVALVAHYQGDYETAKRLFRESLEIKRRAGDTRAVADLLGNLAGIVLVQGDWRQARTLLDESLAIRHRLGDSRGVAYALHYLGELATAMGNDAEAHARYEESMTIKHELGDRWGMAYSLQCLGDLLTARAQYPEAAALLQESLAIRRAVGDRRGAAYSLRGLARLALRQGDIAGAARQFREGLGAFYQLGDKLGLAQCFEGLASTAHGEHRFARAVRLLGIAESSREPLGAPLAPIERKVHEPLLSWVRGRLREAELGAAWAEGAAMPLDAAYDYAIETPVGV